MTTAAYAYKYHYYIVHIAWMQVYMVRSGHYGLTFAVVVLSYATGVSTPPANVVGCTQWNLHIVLSFCVQWEQYVCVQGAFDTEDLW